MIDFAMIKDLIPPQGSINFSVTPGRSGRLIVLVQPIYPKIDGLTGKEEKAYTQARTPLVLEGTPEELNADFMNIMKNTRTEEEGLHHAFNKKQEAIQKAIETKEGKDLKESEKETPKPTQKVPASEPSAAGDKNLQLFG